MNNISFGTKFQKTRVCIAALLTVVVSTQVLATTYNGVDKKVNTRQWVKNIFHKRPSTKPIDDSVNNNVAMSNVAMSNVAMSNVAMSNNPMPYVPVSELLVSNVPMPSVIVTNKKFITTTMIPVDVISNEHLNVGKLDYFLAQVAPNARHYPPNFPSNTQKFNTRLYLKHYVRWIQPYAEQEYASYEVLIRAAQLNGMARNLDMGSDYAVRGQKYVDRALKINEEDVEANLLYGFMLTEGGAFRTGIKYLDKAITLGSVEAEQAIAQTELLNDKRSSALSRLLMLQISNPYNHQIAQQIDVINQGKYYIWDLPANDLNLKSPK